MDTIQLELTVNEAKAVIDALAEKPARTGYHRAVAADISARLCRAIGDAIASSSSTQRPQDPPPNVLWHGWLLRQRPGETCPKCSCTTIVDVPDIGAACIACEWRE